VRAGRQRDGGGVDGEVVAPAVAREQARLDVGLLDRRRAERGAGRVERTVSVADVPISASVSRPDPPSKEMPAAGMALPAEPSIVSASAPSLPMKLSAPSVA
jgi:hypothetical protein